MAADVLLAAAKARSKFDLYLEVLRARGVLQSHAPFIRQLKAYHLKSYIDYLFDGIALANKRMLDVGAGTGVFSAYAALSGATEVVGLEPGAQGSESGARDTFTEVCADLELKNVQVLGQRLEEFFPFPESFDVILLNNSINHLDEAACVTLQVDPEARERYQCLFTRLGSLARPGAILVATDCSSGNFFPDHGIRSPFAPTIEWHKHQHPSVWARELAKAGFRDPSIRWTPPLYIGGLGEVVFGSETAAYFLESHFRLAMTRADSEQSGHGQVS